MSIGAVVVNFNATETLGRCLDSLRSEEEVTSVVVVDNASSDESWRLVPSEMLVRNSSNLGFSKAVNRGVRALGDDIDFILLLNPDAWVEDGAVAEMRRALESVPKAAAAGPRLAYEDGTRIESGRKFPSAMWKLLMGFGLARFFPRPLRQGMFMGPFLPAAGPPLRVDWLLGACMLIRRAAWEGLGGLSEEFFLYGEELDWCWRAARAGWSCLWVPEAVVTHQGRASTAKVFSPEEIDARTFEGMRKACERNMGKARYTAWLFVQSRLGWRGGPRGPGETEEVR